MSMNENLRKRYCKQPGISAHLGPGRAANANHGVIQFLEQVLLITKYQSFCLYFDTIRRHHISNTKMFIRIFKIKRCLKVYREPVSAYVVPLKPLLAGFFLCLLEGFFYSVL